MHARRVFLSAGHSETDPGATAFGRREADIAVDFRNLVAFYLMRDGVPLELDGVGTANLPLAATVARTRQRDDLEVEFHCNAASTPTASGCETLSAARHFGIGGRLCEAIASGLGIRSRGAKPENSGQHRRLAFVQAGGIIVELFFITNPDDLRAYDQRRWLAARNVAAVLAEAVSRPA
jgi:N-acetylmuramoyl-L-alanine amidase